MDTFRSWFGASKVVDGDGNPLMVYHGTNRRFASFDSSRFGESVDAGTLGQGFYFTDRLSSAESYVEWVVWKHGGEARIVRA